VANTSEDVPYVRHRSRVAKKLTTEVQVLKTEDRATVNYSVEHGPSEDKVEVWSDVYSVELVAI
jgi:hypothetical protein